MPFLQGPDRGIPLISNQPQSFSKPYLIRQNCFPFVPSMTVSATFN